MGIRQIIFRFLGPALILAWGGALPAAAATTTPPAELQQPGVLLWGSDAEGGAPYVFHDPQNPDRLIGFEVDLARALARELGVEARQVQTDWDTLIPALQRGDFDIALNGIEWTPDRAREAALSIPYYIYTEQLVVRAEETSIRSFDDVRGRRVGTLRGTAAHQMLQQTPGVETVLYEGQVEPYRDLNLGRLDAVLMDTPIAAYYARGRPEFQYAGPPVGTGVYVIAVRSDHPRLLDRINRGLRKLIETGELRRIYRRWGLWSPVQNRLPEVRPPLAGTRTAGAASNQSLGAYLPLLLQGAGMTVVISVVSMGLAMVLGMGICLMRVSRNPVLKPLAVGFIEVIRGTPLLLQLYIIYYGLPNIGINLNAFTAAVVGLGLNYAAYEAEIYRAGLKSIPTGQTEAALSLGMPAALVYRRILIPQAVRVVLPPVTNDFISLFKDSSLVSILAIVELTKTYNTLAVASMRFLELGLLTALLYLMMSFPLAILSTRLERRFHRP